MKKIGDLAISKTQVKEKGGGRFLVLHIFLRKRFLVLYNPGANPSVYMLILVCFYLYYFNYLPLFFRS